MKLEADCAVIGAGLAGAASAWALTRRGMHRVVILEQEDSPGIHSSGRNAAMLRQVVPEASIAAMAREGARFLDSLRKAWDAPDLVRATGSLLLAGERTERRLAESAALARSEGLDVERWSATRAGERLAPLRGATASAVLWTPSDGVVDVHALLQGLIRDALARGARMVAASPVTEILVDSSRRIVGLRAGELEVRAPRIVNAAGAWAGEVARMAGALPIPLTPLRRHLVHTGAYAGIERSAPYVWDLEEDVYFRPESGGLLLSPCDESIAAPGIPPVDPDAAVFLARKLERAFPSLRDIPVARMWSGLRTFTPDRLFALGPDPLVRGFYWAAGLGGHGVTTSTAAGDLVARTVLDPQSDRENPFSPSRFAGANGGIERTVRKPA